MLGRSSYGSRDVRLCDASLIIFVSSSASAYYRGEWFNLMQLCSVSLYFPKAVVGAIVKTFVR